MMVVRIHLIIFISLFVCVSSCRKFVWDNPNDTIGPKSEPVSLKEGLVAYYPFNGNANDESGNGNNGTVNGATLTTDRFDNSNKAYSFDGVNDYIVSSSTISSLNSVTISGFAYTSNSMGGAFVHIGQDDGINCGGIGIGRGTANSDVGMSFWNLYPGLKLISLVSCVNYYNSNISIADNEWIHFVLVKQGNIFYYYLNGIKVAESQIGNVNTPTPKFFFGTTGMPPPIGIYSTCFSGKLDDIRIYNRALTQEEITYLANN
jgi:hypothetical protein